MKQTYYDILNVSRTATNEDIKNAFRNLAKKFHPDLNKETGSEEIFKIIQEAYEVLSDETKRREYDKTILDPKEELHRLADELKRKSAANPQPLSFFDKICLNKYEILDNIRKIFWTVILIVVPIIMYMIYKDIWSVIYYFVAVGAVAVFHKVAIALIVLYGMISIVVGLWEKNLTLVGFGIVIIVISGIIALFCEYIFPNFQD